MSLNRNFIFTVLLLAAACSDKTEIAENIDERVGPGGNVKVSLAEMEILPDRKVCVEDINAWNDVGPRYLNTGCQLDVPYPYGATDPAVTNQYNDRLDQCVRQKRNELRACLSAYSDLTDKWPARQKELETAFIENEKAAKERQRLRAFGGEGPCRSAGVNGSVTFENVNSQVQVQYLQSPRYYAGQNSNAEDRHKAAVARQVIIEIEAYLAELKPKLQSFDAMRGVDPGCEKLGEVEKEALKHVKELSLSLHDRF